jgi:LacI family transcriptional regulator
MPTIKDVARRAGVGLGTASRVISGNGSVAPATIQRVRQAIDELGYRPSHTARSLLSGTSNMIGVYIPILKGSFYIPLLRIIDAELRANGQHMVLAFGTGHGNARKQVREGVEFLLDRGCDGLLVMSNNLEAEDIDSFGAKAERLVVHNHYLEMIEGQCFTVDHELGGRLAAQVLLDKGHRKFAVISGPSYAPDNAVRVHSFLAELQRAGINPRTVPMSPADFSPEGGRAAAEKLVKRKREFTALFCANDEMATGALSYLQRIGMQVPGQVSVVGYDDVESAEFSVPPLTTVHMPWREMTVNAIRSLLNICYGTTHLIAREYPVQMAWRSTVGPARLLVD